MWTSSQYSEPITPILEGLTTVVGASSLILIMLIVYHVERRFAVGEVRQAVSTLDDVGHRGRGLNPVDAFSSVIIATASLIVIWGTNEVGTQTFILVSRPPLEEGHPVIGYVYRLAPLPIPHHYLIIAWAVLFLSRVVEVFVRGGYRPTNSSGALKPVARRSLISGLIGGLLALGATLFLLLGGWVTVQNMYTASLQWALLVIYMPDLRLLVLAVPVAIGLSVSSAVAGVITVRGTPRMLAAVRGGLSRLTRYAELFPNFFKLALLAAFSAAIADYAITLYAFLRYPWGKALEANRIVIFMSSFMPAPIALTLTFLIGTLFLLLLFLLVKQKLVEQPYSDTILVFVRRLRGPVSPWDLLILVVLGMYFGAALSSLSAFVNWWKLIT